MKRYGPAYLIPLTTAAGLLLGGLWSWLTVALVFALVPLADRLRGTDPANPDPPAPSHSPRHDLLLYGILPVQFAVIALFLHRWDAADSALVQAGWILSTGLVCGGSGIVVAHELLHRRSKVDYWLGKLLLLPALYMHFAIEHVRGHHPRVATDEDPASATLGQSIYHFLPRSIAGQWRSAIRLEADRLRRRGKTPFSADNELWTAVALQGCWLWAIHAAFGVVTRGAALAVAAVAVGMLEIVNYVEHYGLRRARTAEGRYEPVRPCHSWNSDHATSRRLLFELPRHSDHHRNAGRAFQTLRSTADAPQLPAGYPSMILLTLLPPLWFRVMNPRVAAARVA